MNKIKKKQQTSNESNFVASFIGFILFDLFCCSIGCGCLGVEVEVVVVGTR